MFLLLEIPSLLMNIEQYWVDHEDEYVQCCWWTWDLLRLTSFFLFFFIMFRDWDKILLWKSNLYLLMHRTDMLIEVRFLRVDFLADRTLGRFVLNRPKVKKPRKTKLRILCRIKKETSLMLLWWNRIRIITCSSFISDDEN